MAALTEDGSVYGWGDNDSCVLFQKTQRKFLNPKLFSNCSEIRVKDVYCLNKYLMVATHENELFLMRKKRLIKIDQTFLINNEKINTLYWNIYEKIIILYWNIYDLFLNFCTNNRIY